MLAIIIIAQITRTPSEVQSAKVETISHIVAGASTTVHCAVLDDAYWSAARRAKNSARHRIRRSHESTVKPARRSLALSKTNTQTNTAPSTAVSSRRPTVPLCRKYLSPPLLLLRWCDSMATR